MNKVLVFLFSETDEDTGRVIPTQYELTQLQLNDLKVAIKNDQTLLPFGDHFHHVDDIIKFIKLPS